MNIVSKIGVKQDGQDFGWMRNRGDSSRLRTTNSSGYTTSSSSASSNNFNNCFFSSSNTVDGRLKSKPWTESCVEPSFLSSPPQPPPPSSPLASTLSGDSQFSVFGNPIQNSFSSYSDSTNLLDTNQSRESFWSVSSRTDDNINNTQANNSTRGHDGDQLAPSVASLSLHGKSDADRKAPLTIETRRENPPPKSWASIASQPAKTGKTTSLFKAKMAAASVLSASTRPAPIVASLEAFGSWEARNGSSPKSSQITSPPVQTSTKHSPWSSSFSASSSTSSDPTPDQSCSSASSGRDVGFLTGPSVAGGTNGTCNSVPGNNDPSNAPAALSNNNLNSGTGNSNNNNNNTSNNSSSNNNSSSATATTANINNNNCSSSNSSSCASSSNNSSIAVTQRRAELPNHPPSIESSNSAPVRASLNHRNSSSQSIAPSAPSACAAGSTRLVHSATNGSHRDAQYEKENGYRESNNLYMNSHKRNWRESNVEPANADKHSHIGNNGFNNNCHNEMQNVVQRRHERTVSSSSGGDRVAHLEPVVDPSAIMDKQKLDNLFNPKDFDLEAVDARFFVIKSYSEDDIHRSIKYSIWCSTNHGNKRLDNAFKSQEGKGPVYLFYSVNGSGHFCGMAQMMSGVDYDSSVNVWAQDKWKGQFKVKWIYVKDVPNASLRHIRLENNENKQVTNSRDTQEVPHEKGKQVLKIIHSFSHSTSIFDDFLHYEKRQKEEISRKVEAPVSNYRDQRSDVLRPRRDEQQQQPPQQPPQQQQPLESHRPVPSSHPETRHQVNDEEPSSGYPSQPVHREMYRDHRDNHFAGAGSQQQSYHQRGDYSSHRDFRNSHKTPLDACERGHYERGHESTAATGETSAYRDHRYSNHQSVRSYDQGAPSDQRDSYYQPRRNMVHHYSHHSNHHHNPQHHHLQQQTENRHASHYSSNSTSSSSSHHNQRTSWRD